jgi:hypothetical protein
MICGFEIESIPPLAFGLIVTAATLEKSDFIHKPQKYRLLIATSVRSSDTARK